MPVLMHARLGYRLFDLRWPRGEHWTNRLGMPCCWCVRPLSTGPSIGRVAVITTTTGQEMAVTHGLV